MGAQREAEGGRALALAVAGVHEHEAAAVAVGTFVAGFGGGLLDFHERDLRVGAL